MKNYEVIVTNLNKQGLREKLLARRVQKQEGFFTFGRREFEYMNKTDDKLTRVFYSLLSEESLKELKTIDEAIEKIESTISSQSGWWRTTSGFRYEDNFQNMHDPEFRTFDTYTINRNQEGFYVSQEKPFNGYFANIQRKELEFYNKYKELLENLHTLLTRQEEILRGDYILKDENNREFAMAIVDMIHPHLHVYEQKGLTK